LLAAARRAAGFAGDFAFERFDRPAADFAGDFAFERFDRPAADFARLAADFAAIFALGGMPHHGGVTAG
jgi:hypothetical protein